MSEKKRNPQPKKKNVPQVASSPSWTFKSMLEDRHPILKFLLGFLGCMAVFYLIYYSSFYQTHLEPSILSMQANIGNGLLHLLGHNTKVVGAAIGSDNFSVDIQNGCDGLEAMAILVSGILIFPATRRQKATGLLWGVGILFLLNLVRIAGLYLTGLYFSKIVFDLLHVQGGFIIFTMISVLLLFTWMNWVMAQTTKTAAV